MSESTQRHAVWAQLAQAGLVAGAMPTPVVGTTTPWFVRAMLGVAGWIGALFLLGFVAFAFSWVRESALAQLSVGVVVCAIAAAMFRAKRNNDFMAQFAFAISLAGQALIAVGLVGGIKSQLGVAALMVSFVQAVLFIFVANFPHRVWCAWTAATALAFALANWHLAHYLSPLITAALTWIWLSERPYKPGAGAQWRAAGYGLALALVQIVYYDGVVLRWLLYSAGGNYSAWIAGALMAAVWFGLVTALLKREHVALTEPRVRLLWVGAAVVALATFVAPGFAPLLALILLGFAAGVRVMSGLGALALLAYGVHYYYALEITLLQKSIVLMATGAALLLARAALRRNESNGEVAANA